VYCLVQPSQTLDAEASKGPGEKWKVGPQYEVKQLIGSGPQWDLSHDLQSPVPLCRSRFQTALLPGPALTVASVKPLTPPRGVRGTQRKEFDKVTFAGNDHKTCFFFWYPRFRHTQMFGLFPLPGCWNFLCTMLVLGRDPKLNQVEQKIDSCEWTKMGKMAMELSDLQVGPWGYDGSSPQVEEFSSLPCFPLRMGLLKIGCTIHLLVNNHFLQ